MKFEINKFGVAAGVAGSVLFLVKYFFMWLVMSGGMTGMKQMIGMMGAEMNEGMVHQAGKAGAGTACMMSSFGGLIWGFFIVFIIAYFAGILFAWTYNLMSSE